MCEISENIHELTSMYCVSVDDTEQSSENGISILEMVENTRETTHNLRYGQLDKLWIMESKISKIVDRRHSWTNNLEMILYNWYFYGENYSNIQMKKFKRRVLASIAAADDIYSEVLAFLPSKIYEFEVVCNNCTFLMGEININIEHLNNRLNEFYENVNTRRLANIKYMPDENTPIVRILSTDDEIVHVAH